MPTKEQIEQIQWGLDALAAKRAEYLTHRGYYDGDHTVMMSENRLRTIFGDLFAKHRLNLCVPVVDCIKDRLSVSGFSTPGEDAGANADAMDIWQENRMHRRASYLHIETLAAGNAYVIVWPEDGEVRLYPQRSHEVAVEYDPVHSGRIIRAAKMWREGKDNKVHRLNLYYSDRIEKYRVDEGVYGTPAAEGWSYHTLDAEPWPLPNPYGIVPVFHFANNADVGELGVSELKEALPVQDTLNYLSFTLLVGAEFQAFRQRYAIGVELPLDPVTGERINPFTAGPDRVWIAPDGENTSFGEFSAADLNQLDSIKRSAALDMAQVTQTPPHYFFGTTGLVSGESMKTAEQKLDTKIIERQTSFGDVWAEALALAVRMRRGMLADGLELKTDWKNTKSRDAKENWEIATIKAELGVSQEQILREQGYTDEQIEQFATETTGQAPASPLDALLNGGTPNGNPLTFGNRT